MGLGSGGDTESSTILEKSNDDGTNINSNI